MLNSATSISAGSRRAGKVTRPPVRPVSASRAPPPTMTQSVRKVHGGTSCTASFIMGQLKPQVTVSVTSSAMPESDQMAPSEASDAGACGWAGRIAQMRAAGTPSNPESIMRPPQKSLQRPLRSQSP